MWLIVVKRFVMANLGVRRGSDVEYILDETRDGQISEEIYDPGTGQSVVTL